MPSTLIAPHAAHKAADTQTLLKEVIYRLSYRGTLELDCMCRAALPHVAALDEPTLSALRDFLLHTEGELMGWLVDGLPVPAHAQPHVAQLRGWFAASQKS